MSYQFLIAPDFAPERFAGWHLLNTLIQKRLDFGVHLTTPTSHEEESAYIDKGDVSIIYANPFDAVALIRDKGYRAIARPAGKFNEMVIASSAKSDIKALSDLKAGATIAMADNRDVKLIGLRLLEAVDLGESDVNFITADTYQAAARMVMQDKADVAFFIAEIYQSLSALSRSQLHVLIESKIATLSHVVLVKDDFEHATAIGAELTNLHTDDDGRAVLHELGLGDGFDEMNDEDAFFMIDLMETLLD